MHVPSAVRGVSTRKLPDARLQPSPVQLQKRPLAMVPVEECFVGSETRPAISF